jgi:MFS family permease
MVHLVPLLVEGRGFSETPAQAMFAIVSISSLVGQVVGGFLGDRFSKTGIATLCMLGHFCGMTMMAFGGSPVIAVACVIHGLSWGVRGPLMSAIRADYYGIRNFGTIMGYSSVIVMLGPLVGPSLAGALNDRFGDYKFAFALIGAMTGVSSLFFVFSRKPPLPVRHTMGAKHAGGAQ